MPALRVVYVSDEIGRAETVTAHFASRDEARAALSAAGMRVLQIAELCAGERASDPVSVPMAAAAAAPVRETRVSGLTLSPVS